MIYVNKKIDKDGDVIYTLTRFNKHPKGPHMILEVYDHEIVDLYEELGKLLKEVL